MTFRHHFTDLLCCSKPVWVLWNGKYGFLKNMLQLLVSIGFHSMKKNNYESQWLPAWLTWIEISVWVCIKFKNKSTWACPNRSSLWVQSKSMHPNSTKHHLIWFLPLYTVEGSPRVQFYYSPQCCNSMKQYPWYCRYPSKVISGRLCIWIIHLPVPYKAWWEVCRFVLTLVYPVRLSGPLWGVIPLDA